MSKKKEKKEYLYNKDNPKKSRDVYSDDNPKDTIPIKYSTIEELEKTIQKLEKLFKSKKYTHKRIFQVGMIIKVRMEIIYRYRKTRFKKSKNVTKRYKLSLRYYNFLKKRTKLKTLEDRIDLTFTI
tara:strand:+ start:1582 stop:1959 length:378 start_codon:yes stop_codon:yes gene_type:complete